MDDELALRVAGFRDRELTQSTTPYRVQDEPVAIAESHEPDMALLRRGARPQPESRIDLDVISRPEAIQHRPTSARRYAHRHESLIAASDRPASFVEEGLAAEPRSASRAPIGEFYVSLALWAAPGFLMMRSDARSIMGDLFTDPLRPISSTTLALVFALVYVVTTGLAIGASASRVARARPRYVSICLFFVIAPAILVSLASTLTLSLALFFSLLIRCFPGLI
jgi:hypothetical protein